MRISGDRWPSQVENLLALLATGLFAAGLCFVPPSVLEAGDYVAMWKPSFQFLADAVREGRIPLWNPYVHLGRPYLADMPNAAFYPPTYLICLGQTTGVFLLVWLHCLIAICGMRKLAGALGVGRWQTYFMAACFLASGAWAARWATGQLTYAWAVSYVPWLFYCAIRTEEPWRSQRVALHAVLLALQLLCIPQVFWYSAIGQGVFILTRALRLPVGEAVRDAWRGLLQFGVACVWCAGLLAMVLLPFLELVRQSNRSGNSPAFVNSYNLSWGELESLVGPLFPRLDWEGNLFIGAVALVAGCGGLCLLRERNVRGLLGVLVVSMLIALGDRTPFFELFYKWLPGFADFRFHARAGLLVVLMLICGAGIWLSRPHPFLRAAWTRLFGIPIRYALVGMVLLQAADLLGGTWEIKRVITPAARLVQEATIEPGFVQRLVAELRKAGLMEPFQPPPRVCVLPALVPQNYGMIYRYSNPDAYWPLFLRRPWDYLHAALGIAPGENKGCLSPLVYRHSAFPYPDVGLAMGFHFRTSKLVVNTNPSPRVFLVSAAEVADYGTVLERLAHGHDIHRSALLEAPLTEPLPGQTSSPGTAIIRRFEPESLLIEADAKQQALLVLAEAWYPGWRAEIDGRSGACVATNGWMRAVPIPAGRHQIRLYFHQNYMLPGLLISLTSAGLLIAAVVAKPARPSSSGPDPLSRACPPPKARTAHRTRREATQSLKARPAAFPTGWQLLRALVAGALLVGWVAMVGSMRVRGFNFAATQCEAATQFRVAANFGMQGETGQAIAHFTEGLRLRPDSPEELHQLAWQRSASPHVEFHDLPEAVRLAERACQLTDYKEPQYVETLAGALNDLAWVRSASPQAEVRDGPEAVRLAERACQLTDHKVPEMLGTLAAAYAEAGRFEDAIATSEAENKLALAIGDTVFAEKIVKFAERYKARQPVRASELGDEAQTVAPKAASPP